MLQTSGSLAQSTIILPHDYSPVTLLTTVEALHAFTGPVTSQSDSEAWIDSLSQAKQIVAAGRHQEMQVVQIDFIMPTYVWLTTIFKENFIQANTIWLI